MSRAEARESVSTSVASRAALETRRMYPRTQGEPRYPGRMRGMRSWMVTTVGTRGQSGGAK